jgi:2-oxoisovalerate dehydrogenase E1 component beta subunit
MATIAQAIRLALHVGETRLGVKDIFGEDVGPPLGGVFTCTQGLKNAWNAPLDERGIVGMAVGLAFAGQRPVAEIQFSDYIYNTIDLLKLAGNTHWCFNGNISVPLVFMTPAGSGIHGSIYHSHSFDAMATHIPGCKVVYPSTPIDVYGLMISSIKDNNPVIFMYPKALIRVVGEEKIPGEPENQKELSEMIDAPVGDRSKWKPRWPELPDFEIPIGKALIRHEGNQLTVVSYGRGVHMCVTVAKKIQQEHGVSIEVIDLRSLMPWDRDCVFNSVQKTGKLLVVNEDTEVTNFGEHIIRAVMDEHFYALQAAPKLLAGANTPGIGLAPPLEEAQVPQESTIEKAMLDLISTNA